VKVQSYVASRSDHVHSSRHQGYSEVARSAKVLLLFLCSQPNIGFAGASRCSTKDPPFGIGEPFVAVRIAKPRAFRRTTEFTSC
jgi:hypothetical protein